MEFDSRQIVTVNIAPMEGKTMMKERENNVTVNNWKNEFAEVITQRLGHAVTSRNILSDENGFAGCIVAKSLESNAPLMLVINRYGDMVVIIPYKEYETLEKEVISPVDYVSKAVWNYGWYIDQFDSPDNVESIFWQPVEKKPGMNDLRMVRTYISQVKCKLQERITGHEADEEKCSICRLEKCSYAKVSSKAENVNTALEVKEKDYREQLYDAIKNRIKDEFGLEIISISQHEGGNIRLIAEPDSYEEVHLSVSAKTHNYILYHPTYRNWKQYAKSYQVELGTTAGSTRVLVRDNVENPAEYCRKKFAEMFALEAEKAEEAAKAEEVETKVEVMEPIEEAPAPEKKGFISRMFGNLFGKK